MEICFQCLADNNCDDIFDNDGDNDWDNENYCEDLSEDECSITEGCQWYDGEGCFRYEDEEDNDWDDENPEGCLELSQDECVSTEGCEWIGSSPNMPGGGYCIENNNEDFWLSKFLTTRGLSTVVINLCLFLHQNFCQNWRRKQKGTRRLLQITFLYSFIIKAFVKIGDAHKRGDGKFSRSYFWPKTPIFD